MSGFQRIIVTKKLYTNTLRFVNRNMSDLEEQCKHNNVYNNVKLYTMVMHYQSGTLWSQIYSNLDKTK